MGNIPNVPITRFRASRMFRRPPRVQQLVNPARRARKRAQLAERRAAVARAYANGRGGRG